MAGAQATAERFEEAQELLARALIRAAPERAKSLPLRARILLAIAAIEDSRGNYLKAVDWAQQAIDVRKRLPTTTSADMAEALALRGLYMFRGGQIPEAEQPLRAALAQLNPEDPDNFRTLLRVRLCLGQVLTSLGRFDEALPLLRANAAATRRLYGDEHPVLADALHQLGAVMRQSGDAKSAIPIFQEALEIYERKYGPEHSFTATALTSLGQALSASGQHQPAIDALARAHDIYVKTMGPGHTFTVINAIGLADARLAAGDFAGAETGFRAALDSFQHIGDGKHIYAEAARLGLGHTLAAEHRYTEAVAPLGQARSRFVEEFGADDRRAIDASVTLVHCLLQSKRREDARAVLEESERALAASSHEVKRLRALVETARREFDGA
jgi:tetratricopeptide (TPR) repeat protein